MSAPTALSSIARDRLNQEVQHLFYMNQHRPTVVGIVHTTAGYLLVQSAKGEQPWGFVQGGIEEHEDIIDALYRELREEAGIECDASDVPVHCMTFSLSGPGDGRFLSGKQYYVFVVHLSRVPEITLKEDELRAYEWCTPWQSMGVIATANNRHADKGRLLLDSLTMAFAAKDSFDAAV